MILFADSGVGGLVYLQELRQRRRELSLGYLADTAGFPYGERAPDNLRSRILLVVSTFLEQCTADDPLEALVVACNTASVAALDMLRQHLSVAVVGVVPAVKPAAAHTRTGHLAILSTRRTAGDPYTADLVSRFASQCRVTTLGLPDLIAEIEAAGCREGDQRVLAAIRRDVVQSLPRDVDVVVLACTHFVGYRELFSAALGPGVTVLDSLEGVTNRLCSLFPRDHQRAGGMHTVPVYHTAADPPVYHCGSGISGYRMVHLPIPGKGHS